MLPPFLLSFSYGRSRQYVIHTRQPLIVIEVFHDEGRQPEIHWLEDEQAFRAGHEDTEDALASVMEEAGQFLQEHADALLESRDEDGGDEEPPEPPKQKRRRF